MAWKLEDVFMNVAFWKLELAMAIGGGRVERGRELWAAWMEDTSASSLGKCGSPKWASHIQGRMEPLSLSTIET